MAICNTCKQEMLTAQSCSVQHATLLIGGTRFKRIPASEDDGEERCGDCGVRLGGLHHPGCDMEICPRCDGQLISCKCVDDDDFGEQRVLALLSIAKHTHKHKQKRKRRRKHKRRNRRKRARARRRALMKALSKPPGSGSGS